MISAHEFLQTLIKTLIALEDVTDSPSLYTHIKQLRGQVENDPVWTAIDIFLDYYEKEILRQAYNEQFEEAVAGLFTEEELQRLAGDE